MIKFLPCKSKGLRECGYDESTETLFIRFPSGAIYKYFNVPKTLWDKFSATFQAEESSNAFFMKNIRAAGFKYEKVIEEVSAETGAGTSLPVSDKRSRTSEQIQKELVELENLFKYHAPTPDQIERYALINEAALNLARTIIVCCPPSADRSAAIRQVREARMTANASIACNE